MLCNVRLCNVMLCNVMSCNVMLCNVISCYVMLCNVMLCCAMLCHVMLCHVMLCYVILCYVMLWYVMLWYDMICYFISDRAFLWVNYVVFSVTKISVTLVILWSISWHLLGISEDDSLYVNTVTHFYKHSWNKNTIIIKFEYCKFLKMSPL